MVIHLLLLCNLYITHTWSLVLLQRNIVWISDFKRNDVHFPSNLEFLFVWQVNPYFISTLMFVSHIMPRYVNVLFFFMLRNQDLPKQSSCISKLMVLLYCTYQFWLVPWSVALVSQTTRDDVYHVMCIDLWIFFFIILLCIITCIVIM